MEVVLSIIDVIYENEDRGEVEEKKMGNALVLNDEPEEIMNL